MSTQLKQAAVEIVKELRRAGHEAYFAGGCVRDLLMGREPHDIDIATSARPEEVMRIFARAVPVGLKYGVVLVLRDRLQFEVTTFRREGPYLDGRHPSSVTFATAREDAERRDFTINGLFYDPLAERVIDFVGGARDIEAGVIRAIGDAGQRFEEDKLRMMRALRFAARFGFRLEPGTWKAISERAGRIAEVSRERVRDELIKMLSEGGAALGFRLLSESRLLEAILPEVAAMRGVPQPQDFHPEGDVFTHTLILIDMLESPSTALAFGALLHDVGKPPTFSVRERIRFDQHSEVGAELARRICRRLRLSNQEVEEVEELVRDHLRFINVKQMRESTLKRFLRKPNFQDHLELHRLDCLASHGNLENWYFCRQKLAELTGEQIAPPRLITGYDLIALGFEPGPLFREMLSAVEDAQLEGRISTREEALELVKREFKKQGPGAGGQGPE